MAKYTEQIDAQIGELFQTQGEVTPEMIAGVTDDEARSFLGFYASSHPEHSLVFDGVALKEESAADAAVSEDQQGGWTDQEMQQAEAAAEERGLGFEPAAQDGFAGGADEHVPDQPTGYRSIPPGTRPTSDNDPLAGLDITPEPRTQPVSGWLWLLVFFAAPLGAIAAWAIARDKNRTTARTMLVVGIVIMVAQACIGFSLGGTLGGMSTMTSSPTDAVWPGNGHLTFYYFGLPG